MIKSLDQLPPLVKYRPGRVIIGIDPGVSGGVRFVMQAGRD